MKIKKLLALVMTGVITASTLAACGSNNNGNNAGEEAGIVTELEEAVEIDFWHAMNGHHETILEELTDDFNASQDMITVNLMNQGSYGDLSTKLLASARADELPAMTQAYPNWMDDYLDMDILAPLDAYINDSEIGVDTDDFVEAFLAEGSQWEDGLQYGLPFNKSSEVLFFNQTAYEEAGVTEMPTTWGELEEAAKAYYDTHGVAGLGWDDEASMFFTLLFQNGGSYVENGEALFNDETGIEALEFVVNGADEGWFRIGGEDGYLSDVLSNGQVGAYVGSSAGAAYINAEDFELGVTTVPQAGDVLYNSQAGTQLITFNTASPEENLAAYTYMTFLAEEENTAYWAMETGYIPVTNSGIESDAYQAFLAEDETAQAAAESTANIGVEPVFEGSYTLRNVVRTEAQNAILGSKSVEDALQYAADEYER